jgi:hypothetical protein
MNEHARGNATHTLIAGIVLLIVFWWYTDFGGFSEDSVFNILADVSIWTFRIGGVALVLISLSLFAGRSIGLLLDAVVSACIGIVMLACGVYGAAIYEESRLYYLLFALFGLIFSKAAYNSFQAYKHRPAEEFGAAPASAMAGGPEKPPADEPVHPASVHPDALPEDGEPPPDDGYLAALSKEKDEPPSDSEQ